MPALLIPNQVRELVDVEWPDTPADRYVLVYNAQTSKSELRALTQADVTGLVAALAAKADNSALTWSGISGKPSTFAPSAHVHTLADITNAGTAAAANIGSGAGNVPVLGVGGKLPSAVLPSIAITDTNVVASQAAMLALIAERGDIAIRTDTDETYVLAAEDPTQLANWVKLRVPTASSVASVNGQAGNVVIDASDILLDKNNPAGDTVSAYSETLATIGEWSFIYASASEWGRPNKLLASYVWIGGSSDSSYQLDHYVNATRTIAETAMTNADAATSAASDALTQLSNKADVGHTHSWYDITDIPGALTDLDGNGDIKTNRIADESFGALSLWMSATNSSFNGLQSSVENLYANIAPWALSSSASPNDGSRLGASNVYVDEYSNPVPIVIDNLYTAIGAKASTSQLPGYLCLDELQLALMNKSATANSPTTTAGSTLQKMLCSAGTNTPPDWWEWTVPLRAGSYRIIMRHNPAANRGIFTLQINGVTFATVDQYAASSTANSVMTFNNVAVPQSGESTLRLTVTGKNASSSANTWGVQAFIFIRTGD